MEFEKKLLDGIITDYYESIKDMFNYRLKNNWKIDTSSILYNISIFFLIINIIPMMPYLSDNYFRPLLIFISDSFSLGNIELTFMIRWGLGSITAVFIWGILFLPYKYWSIKEKKKALEFKYMSFCYAFTLRKELRNYLINGNKSHLENSVNYFNKVTHWIINAEIETNDKSTSLSLFNLKKEITNQFEWFELTPETNEIIDSISGIENKVVNRLKNETDIEKILPLIDLLTLYKYSAIKPKTIDEKGVEIGDRKIELIKSISKEIRNLEEFELKCENDKNDKNIFKSIYQSMSNLFYESNILSLFVCWLILLSLLFVPLATMIISFLKVNIDSTILIGLLTAPFLGAITFTATIYTKRQK